MNKITRLTEDQYNKLVKTKKLGINLRKLLGIPKTKKVYIGDTLCMLGQQSETKDVFECIHSGKRVLYVVCEPLDEIMAACYSIYFC